MPNWSVVQRSLSTTITPYAKVSTKHLRVNNFRCAHARARGTDGRAKKSFLAKCAVAFVDDHADAASTSKAASCRRHRACGNDVVSAPMVARAPGPLRAQRQS